MAPSPITPDGCNAFNGRWRHRPDGSADGEIFTVILNLVGSRRDRFELGEVWAAMTRDGSAFAGLKLDEIGPHGAALGAPGGR